MPPLDGVRVLDLTRLLPGAYATLLLVDLGADVIKIEDPRGGDSMRHLSTHRHGSVFFERLNRGKRSVTLDLRSPEAAGVLDALAEKSDVMVDSFRPSTARRLGVDATSMQARHRRLVCASINGFGLTGPDAERAAHDINYQALAGLLAPRGSTLREPQGRPEPSRETTSSPRAGAGDASLAVSLSKGEPRMPGPLVGDVGAAWHAALAIVAALFERQRTGVGRVVDVAIGGVARTWAAFPSTDDLASACYNLYETADGEWLALGALEPKFWTGFCERIGRPDLIAQQHARGDDGARVLGDVRAVMKTRTRDEWTASFADADVCLTPVHPAVDRALSPGEATRPAPALGADTDRVLDEAGIDDARRRSLRSSGVI